MCAPNGALVSSYAAVGAELTQPVPMSAAAYSPRSSLESRQQHAVSSRLRCHDLTSVPVYCSPRNSTPRRVFVESHPCSDQCEQDNDECELTGERQEHLRVLAEVWEAVRDACGDVTRSVRESLEISTGSGHTELRTSGPPSAALPLTLSPSLYSDDCSPQGNLRIDGCGTGAIVPPAAVPVFHTSSSGSSMHSTESTVLLRTLADELSADCAKYGLVLEQDSSKVNKTRMPWMDAALWL